MTRQIDVKIGLKSTNKICVVKGSFLDKYDHGNIGLHKQCDINNHHYKFNFVVVWLN